MTTTAPRPPLPVYDAPLWVFAAAERAEVALRELAESGLQSAPRVMLFDELLGHVCEHALRHSAQHRRDDLWYARRRRASPVEQELVARRVVAELYASGEGVYARVAQRGGFVAALLEFFAECREGNATDEVFRAFVRWLAREGGGVERRRAVRVSELERLLRGYERGLESLGLLDEGLVLRVTLDALRDPSVPLPPMLRRPKVCFQDIHDWSPIRVDIARAMARRLADEAFGGGFYEDRVELHLPYDFDRPNLFHYLEPILRQVESLEGESLTLRWHTANPSWMQGPLERLAEEVWSSVDGAGFVQDEAPAVLDELGPDILRVVVAPGDQREARVVARRARELLAQGVSPEAIVIAPRQLDDGVGAICEALDAYGVPWSAKVPRSLMATPLARLVVALCRLVLERMPREAFVAVLSSDYVGGVGLEGPWARHELAQLLREAGVRNDLSVSESGRSAYEERLMALAARFERRYEEASARREAEAQGPVVDEWPPSTHPEVQRVYRMAEALLWLRGRVMHHLPWREATLAEHAKGLRALLGTLEVGARASRAQTSASPWMARDVDRASARDQQSWAQLSLLLDEIIEAEPLVAELSSLLSPTDSTLADEVLTAPPGPSPPPPEDPWALDFSFGLGAPDPGPPPWLAQEAFGDLDGVEGSGLLAQAPGGPHGAVQGDLGDVVDGDGRGLSAQASPLSRGDAPEVPHPATSASEPMAAGAQAGGAGRSLSLSDFVERLVHLMAQMTLPPAGASVGGVRLVPVTHLAGVRVPHVIIPGLAQGSFPKTLRSRPLFTDDDRIAFGRFEAAQRRRRGEDALRMSFPLQCVPYQEEQASGAPVPARQSEEVLLFTFGLSAPTESLTLTRSSLDRAGRRAMPSVFLDEVLRRVPEPHRKLVQRQEGLDPVPPVEDCVAPWELMARAQLSVLGDGVVPYGDWRAAEGLRAALEASSLWSPEVTRGAEVERSRHALSAHVGDELRVALASDPMGHYGGRVGDVHGAWLSEVLAFDAEKPLSSGMLNRFGGCPQRFLLSDVLHLRPRAVASQDVSATDRHEAVQRMLSAAYEALSERQLLPLGRGDEDGHREALSVAMGAAGEALQGLEEVTERAHPQLWGQVRGVCEELVQQLIVREQSGGARRHVAMPWRYGSASEGERVEVELSAGVKVHLSGRVDRVLIGESLGPGGKLELVSYGTSALSTYERRLAEGHLWEVEYSMPLAMLAVAEGLVPRLQASGAVGAEVMITARYESLLEGKQTRPLVGEVGGQAPLQDDAVARSRQVIAERVGQMRLGDYPFDTRGCARCDFRGVCRRGTYPEGG